MQPFVAGSRMKRYANYQPQVYIYLSLSHISCLLRSFSKCASSPFISPNSASSSDTLGPRNKRRCRQHSTFNKQVHKKVYSFHNTTFTTSGFIQNIFLGGGNVDSCNGHMRVSVHSLRFLWIFVKLWTCLRTRNVKFSCNTLSLCTLLCCIPYCS